MAGDPMAAERPGIQAPNHARTRWARPHERDWEVRHVWKSDGRLRARHPSAGLPSNALGTNHTNVIGRLDMSGNPMAA